MADYGKLNFSVAFNPTSAFPIDARCFFSSFDDAKAAAATAEEVGSKNTVYYYGQKLLVYENGEAVWYKITTEKELEPEASGTVNVATETPHFNLTELGLPALTIGGNAVKLTTDTADVMAALDSGAVKFTFAVNMGNILPVSCVMTNIAAMGSYVCSYIFDFNGIDINLVLEIYEGGITAAAKVLFESVVTEIEAISDKLNDIDALLDLINGEVV